MPDGLNAASFPAPTAPDGAQAAYLPPVSLVLAGLGVTELDLGKSQVAVSGRFLRFLITELARLMPFDAAFYSASNPDVEAARLAGDVTSLHDHFIEQGYFEHRAPCDLPFDAFYYATHYDDLSRAFDMRDATGLRRHYQGHGWQEGRVGVSGQRADAERWNHAARAAAAV
jgi:hypothetical protein